MWAAHTRARRPAARTRARIGTPGARGVGGREGGEGVYRAREVILAAERARFPPPGFKFAIRISRCRASLRHDRARWCEKEKEEEAASGFICSSDASCVPDLCEIAMRKIGPAIRSMPIPSQKNSSRSRDSQRAFPATTTTTTNGTTSFVRPWESRSLFYIF